MISRVLRETARLATWITVALVLGAASLAEHFRGREETPTWA